MNRNFEIIKGDENKIISLKRLIDGVIFKVGDTVALDFQIKEGTPNEKIIQKFMTETDRTHNNMHLLGDFQYPVGTIVTKEGIIQIENAGHVEYDSENYKIMNTPILLTVREILQLTDLKYKKKLVKISLENLNKAK